MNFLTLIILAILVQSADADTEKVVTEKADTEKADTENSLTVARVTTVSIEIATSPEEGKLIKDRAARIGGMLVVCESLKLSVTDKGKVLECEGCSFNTPTGIRGTAPSAVFDLSKGIVTLAGDDTTQVRLVIHGAGEKVEQTLVANTIEMSVPPAGPQRTNQGRHNTDDFPGFDPASDDFAPPREKQQARSVEFETDSFYSPEAVDSNKSQPTAGKTERFKKPASVETDKPTNDSGDFKLDLQ